MQNLKKTLYKVLCGLALALTAAGCADILRAPLSPEAAPGTVTFIVSGGPARTAAPLVSQFGKITLTITGQNGSADIGDIDATPGSAAVTFPAGSWKITAKAYLDAAGADLAAESAEHDFSWDGTNISFDGSTLTGNPTFILSPTGTGPGTLKYTVTVPSTVTLAGTGSQIRIEKDGAAPADLDDDGFTDGVHAIAASVADATVSLPAGTYTAAIVLVNGGSDTAVYRESVVILPGLVTEIRFEPGTGDFLDPTVRAAMTDIEDAALEFGETAVGADEIKVVLTSTNPASPTLAISAPNETAGLYFTLAKTADYRVTVSGTDAALVTMLADGTTLTDGSEAGPTLAVFRVDTSGVAAAGGDVAFTLTITREGMTGVDLAVTVTVAAPQPGDGPGLYVDTAGVLTAEAGFTNTGADSELLENALTWLETNATDDTKYVILLDSDFQMDTPFSSKTGSTGVRVTLRGLESERKIYWDDSDMVNFPDSWGAGLFILKDGTTLALDENITLGGQGTYKRINHLVFQDNGSTMGFEMLPGSRIAGVKPNNEMIVIRAGSFVMKGGTIENNSIPGFSPVIGVVQASFDMYDGAEIRDNALEDPTGLSAQVRDAVVNGSGAIVSIVGSSRFTMHGGSITDNAVRAVIISGSSANDPGIFTMTGGEISGNGAGEFYVSGNATPYYVLGAGVYGDRYFKIELTGGAITNNGHPNSLGGGMLLRNYTTAAQVPVPVLLNGPVNFDGNRIALDTEYIFLIPKNTKHITLGTGFVNGGSGPITFEMGASFNNSLGWGYSIDDLVADLNGEYFLNPDGTVIADLVEEFAADRFYFEDLATFAADFSFTGLLNFAINSDGTLSVSKK
jgi:hypothetical protein